MQFSSDFINVCSVKSCLYYFQHSFVIKKSVFYITFNLTMHQNILYMGVNITLRGEGAFFKMQLLILKIFYLLKI